MTQTPTDALRLVPVEPTEAMLEAAWEATRAATPEQRMLNLLGEPKAGHDLKMKTRWFAMLAAAPASPLPGGGDVDWQDKAEGLESDLRQAVLVAWKRGAEEWCRLNYPQWIEWLEACQPAAPTGDAK